jgi:hypothetical protein
LWEVALGEDAEFRDGSFGRDEGFSAVVVSAGAEAGEGAVGFWSGIGDVTALSVAAGWACGSLAGAGHRRISGEVVVISATPLNLASLLEARRG